MKRTVGLGGYAISNSQGDILVTHGLASCIAVAVYSPSKKVSGMVHIVLPSPPPNQMFSSGPYYYAATGIPLLINRMCSEYGCLKSNLCIGIFGGADSIREEDFFMLGQKNKDMVEKVLKGLNLSYDASETGGTVSRTLEMDVETGIVKVSYQPITI